MLRTICLSTLVVALTPLRGQAVAGTAYFQQRVDYVIDVRLDDTAHVLHGFERFVYTNNSPHRLDTLWIHLWPNAYRDQSTALCAQMDRMGELDLHFATAEERGYIDSLAFEVNGVATRWGQHAEHIDIAWLELPAPLEPGGSITVATPFRVKIPDSKFSRLGHTGQAYHITQWYPKPAVFDREGWHAMPYLTLGEFYSEFGSFDVTITLPANYVVGATGVLQTTQERELMDRMASPEWQYPEPIRDPHTGKPQYNQFPVSSTQLKTLRYVQDQVHDFAWFADKRFMVRKGRVTLPRSGREVTTWAMFTPKNAKQWEAVGITALNESVRLYSEWVGDYPYAACTAVDGTISAGGGMEYPMITIIGNMGSTESLDNVIAHEVGHNWFYGILASNERDHAWMDEGMNSFVELRYMRLRYPTSQPGIGLPGERKLFGDVKDGHRFRSEATYRLNARRNLDQPIAMSAGDFTPLNYGAMVYGKTALVFDHLFDYLGDEIFDRCIHAYFEEWKFRHPAPQDVRAVFERESGKDLGWLFNDLIGTSRKLDFKALELRAGPETLDGRSPTLSFRSNDLRGAPVSITGYEGGQELGSFWMGTTGMKEEVQLPWPTADKVRLDAGARTLDIDRRNNEVRSRGLFRRGSRPEVKFLLGLEKDDRHSLFWTPLAAWNGHDGFQIGLAAYNTVFPCQRTEWIIAPLYALGSERPGGAARVEHHFDRMDSRLFQNIHVGLNLRSASTLHDHYDDAWYTKLSPTAVFDLKRDPLSRPWQHSVSLRAVQLWQETRSVPAEGIKTGTSTSNTYVELGYRMINSSALSPTEIMPIATWSEDLLRASIEVKQAFTYNDRKDQLRLRAFAGTLFTKGSGFYDNALNAWGLSWGPEDLLFDQAYFERGADQAPLGQQFSKQQGAFKTPFAQGGSEAWIASINAELDLPIPIPLSLFGSAGYVPMTTRTTESVTTGTASYYEAGIGLQLVRDAVELWVPLFVSDRISKEEDSLEREFGDRIRFVFALERMDPTKAMRKLAP